jgi:hypothetical protein
MADEPVAEFQLTEERLACRNAKIADDPLALLIETRLEGALWSSGADR